MSAADCGAPEELFIIEAKRGPRAAWRASPYETIGSREERAAWLAELNEHGAGVFRLVPWSLAKHGRRRVSRSTAELIRP